MIFTIIGLITVLALSYWNGANDVSKTIATIVGAKLTDHKKAIWFGALFNTIGTFLALFFATAILKVFTKGLLREANVGEIFAISIIIGALIWIIIATYTAMPVSTTHSMLGAIIFLGIFVYSLSGILWNSVILKIFLPLILSPLISFVLAYLIFWSYLRFSKIIKSPTINNMNKELHKRIDKSLRQKIFSIDNAHWISAAASSFARGMNDGPKFVALAAIFLISSHISPNFSITTMIFAGVALAMGLGGIIHGTKVTKTLSFKVTEIDHHSGFIANFITSILVTGGASIGLPMSTTHVSSFAIIGIGTKKGVKKVHWKTVEHMLFSWIITLPVSGFFAILSYNLLRFIAV